MNKKKFAATTSAILLTILSVLTFNGCGNMSCSPGNYSFNKIHVDIYQHSMCLTVESWHDDERGIEVKTKEAGSMYFSEGTYILIEDTCPFCAEHEAADDTKDDSE